MTRRITWAALLLGAGVLLSACAGNPSQPRANDFAGGAMQNGAMSIPSDMVGGPNLTIFSMPSK